MARTTWTAVVALFLLLALASAPAWGDDPAAEGEAKGSLRISAEVDVSAAGDAKAVIRLAFHPEVAERVLAEKLASRTPKTVTDPKRIRTALAEVREKGYAVTRSENHPEMGGIAAPLRDHSGEVIAACGLGIPAFRMDRALIDRAIPLVVRASAEISRLLGHIPSKGRITDAR